VQEDERLAFTDDLVAELDSIDPGDTGGIRRHRHIALAAAGAVVDDRRSGLTGTDGLDGR